MSECFLAPRYTRFIAFTSKNDNDSDGKDIKNFIYTANSIYTANDNQRHPVVSSWSKILCQGAEIGDYQVYRVQMQCNTFFCA